MSQHELLNKNIIPKVTLLKRLFLLSGEKLLFTDVKTNVVINFQHMENPWDTPLRVTLSLCWRYIDNIIVHQYQTRIYMLLFWNFCL